MSCVHGPSLEQSYEPITRKGACVTARNRSIFYVFIQYFISTRFLAADKNQSRPEKNINQTPSHEQASHLSPDVCQHTKRAAKETHTRRAGTLQAVVSACSRHAAEAVVSVLPPLNSRSNSRQEGGRRQHLSLSDAHGRSYLGERVQLALVDADAHKPATHGEKGGYGRHSSLADGESDRAGQDTVWRE